MKTKQIKADYVQDSGMPSNCFSWGNVSSTEEGGQENSVGPEIMVFIALEICGFLSLI